MPLQVIAKVELYCDPSWIQIRTHGVEISYSLLKNG
jgi:hypothetical protein